MTIKTTTATRRSSSAPRVSLRRGLFLTDPRREPREIPRPNWVGSLVVQR